MFARGLTGRASGHLEPSSGLLDPSSGGRESKGVFQGEIREGDEIREELRVH
jgi:hypothetical protein